MIFRSFLTATRRAFLDRGGNFAMVTTLMLFPMIAMTGLSIDFWSAYETKIRLDEAADAAAIAAINMDSKAYINALNGAAKVEWDKEAERFFLGEASQIDPRLQLVTKTDVQRAGGKLVSVVDYETALPTSFMKVVGFRTIAVHGHATAEFEVGNYYNIHILLDNSPSMGLGASQKDLDIMNASMTCAFACHDLSKRRDTWLKAKALGVQLRFDVVLASINKLADVISARVEQKVLYRIALYSMGETEYSSSGQPVKINNLTNDMNALKTSSQKVHLMAVESSTYLWDFALSSLNDYITLFNFMLPDPGKGSGVSDAKEVALIITDGAKDEFTMSKTCNGLMNGSRCVGPVDIKFCQDFKDRGIKVAILHTLYLPLPDDQTYKDRIGPVASTIAPALEACASPGLYQAVDMKADMFLALKDLFYRAVGSPRLTN